MSIFFNYRQLLGGVWLAVSPLVFSPSISTAAEASHGLALHGDIKYGPDFTHFEYVNPDAPKGGSVTRGVRGTFDNTNPFILKGLPAAGSTSIYDTLTVNSMDEPFAVYGLLAESIEVPDDKRWVTYRMRKEARWHDGVALTADDVVWTFDTIMKDGHPAYKSYFGAIAKAEKLDSHTVKFSFSEGNNSELPLITGQLPILPKHFWENRDFTKTTLDPLLGSGAYKMNQIDAGRSISYERVDDYWARNLPVNVGHDNFDSLKYEYYRDTNVIHEAFKSGDVDFVAENNSKRWATAYDFPAVTDGRVVKDEIPDASVQQMQGFIFNTRKEKFQDVRVREALGFAFDFEWINKNLFYGAYQRTTSYFQNSEFQATGLPEGEELELLERFKGQIPESVFTKEFTVPQTDGSGNLRTQYRSALKLLREAGWVVKDGKLTHQDTGEVFQVELLYVSTTIEKLALTYKKALERLGIDMQARLVDSSQYQERVDNFDYDMIVSGWAQSRSPGNEQKEYWSTAAADTTGSRNLAGIKSPAIDELIAEIIKAPSRERLVTTTKALDRVLLHSHYLVPHYFVPIYRTAYWNKFERPEIVPQNLMGFNTWWINVDKEQALNQ
ncbi:MAG: extracellular solute-binding protein [Gammaproteobacteria bacterium]|nr:extracellular solute-binding protein [Gammaproteobacteria bacterium]